MRTTRLSTPTALTAVTALALAACAPVEEGGEGAAADDGGLATVTEGTLTIGTSDPAYAPWVMDNDPTSGEGFESAVAVNQVSITDERRENLDFSSSYYDTAQALVGLEGTPAAAARDTLGEGMSVMEDLKALRIGAMVGTTSATVAETVIAPTTPVQLFNDNDQVKQALTAGLVDAIVVDLPTALYITAAELEGGVLVGQLPPGENPDQFGLVLDKDSELTDEVTEAVDALREDGTLAELEAEWLTDAAGAPVLE